ncbi:hypothetical protein OY14_04370 (plasmid) [Borreliella chilensis]|uniref:Uncharacterized protein n=1 Tax=Borreliella chilensis TaxID=1245910 RepID=A0A0A7UWU3_9SPIR|nr:hypothetical protein OY14_04370 [Borreliella chilensis]
MKKHVFTKIVLMVGNEIYNLNTRKTLKLFYNIQIRQKITSLRGYIKKLIKVKGVFNKLEKSNTANKPNQRDFKIGQLNSKHYFKLITKKSNKQQNKLEILSPKTLEMLN